MITKVSAQVIGYYAVNQIHCCCTYVSSTTFTSSCQVPKYKLLNPPERKAVRPPRIDLGIQEPQSCVIPLHHGRNKRPGGYKNRTRDLIYAKDARCQLRQLPVYCLVTTLNVVMNKSLKAWFQLPVVVQKERWGVKMRVCNGS